MDKELNEPAGYYSGAAARDLQRQVDQALAPGRHGNLAAWRAALNALPPVEQGWRIENGVLVAGAIAADRGRLAETLESLIPWRKGPLRLGGVSIDTEWRSDWKWNRIAPHIDLAGQRVLDIGSGNGYFGWRMLDAGARQVVGCDPTLVFYMQYRAIRHFSGPVAKLLLPLKFEALPANADFDSVFSMGVLYHRKNPMEHLTGIRRQLRPGARLVLETLIIAGREDAEIDPHDRYANMRNVHHLPTLARLTRWLSEAGFDDIEAVDQTATTIDEQRSTCWMPFHSLANALDIDGANTIEGHPRPLRAVLIAK
ncbi:MAG: tRNA 5-methoxyuridine(34)/uridine 5-oxyacetic acid(34) synthase CmoB [Wenzhouxiangellaceae bacterium]|nr:tRNA 5-methoxyuridine(34)/uridine 5-oxyacetic acid(34) synthase CmoB [Wenzhouxiangellaceae bacterium]